MKTNKTSKTQTEIQPITSTGWKIDKIMLEILRLSHSQGHWGRLYYELVELRDSGDEGWKKFVEDVEYEEFQELLDLVYYFEEGEHTKLYYRKKICDGYKIYDVKVQRSLECDVQVLAKDEDEASSKAIYESMGNGDMTEVKTTVTGVREINRCLGCGKSKECSKAEHDRSD